jgi:hypothetical protein
VNVAAMAEAMNDIPDTDDFLTGDTNGKSESIKMNRKSFMMHKKGFKSNNKIDSKVFDAKLIDRGLTLLLEF